MKRINLITVFIIINVLFIAFVALVAIFYSGKSDNAEAQLASGASGRDSYNILLLGKDAAAGLCDVIMLASVNIRDGEVNVLQLPRDTYFNYGNGVHCKINGAPAILGASEFTDALSAALGINIDYYLSMNIAVLEDVVDMISGIDINVPTDMDYDDPAQNLSIHLKAGENHLNGKDAVGFLRFRSGYATGDIGRLDAQKLFMDAFFTRIAEQSNLTLIYNIVKCVSQRTQTNIREQDIISLGLKLNGKKDISVYYVTAPGEAVQSEISGAWYYILSKDSASELLAGRFGAVNKDFDKDNKFVDKRIKSFYDIYIKRCEYKILSTEDIKNNKVNIN